MSVRVIKGQKIKSDDIIQRSKDRGTYVQKATQSTSQDQSSSQHGVPIDNALPTPFPIDGLQMMVEKSTILQQCITAYKRNIVGFGAQPQYINNELQERKNRAQGVDNAREGSQVPSATNTTLNPQDPTENTGEASESMLTAETPEMIAEWEQVKDFTEMFNFVKSFEEIMGALIEDREITGNFYCELIRDGQGKVVEGNRLNPRYIQCTVQEDKGVPTDFIRNGRKFTRNRRFRKYVQRVGAKNVWFKELGDPRKMDMRTGQYDENVSEEFEANEIWHDRIGEGAYGIPRWIGQLIHMYGARKAEELNLRYFEKGRHTPMAIVVSNGQLTPQTEGEIEAYLQDIEGVDNAHGFLVIEAEGTTSDIADGEEKSAKVELKSLADVIQKDALFLDYDAKSREKIQSAFALPDIYVGRSADFNRATADTAREITEEQVFNPERTHLEWHINHRLMAEYELQYAQLVFKKPEASSIEEFSKVMELLIDSKAITTNEIRDVSSRYIAIDLESLGEEYDKPLGSSGGSPATASALNNLLAIQGNPNQPNATENIGGASVEEVEKRFESYYNRSSDSLLNAVHEVLRKRKEE